jgi:hypothetical protein
MWDIGKTLGFDRDMTNKVVQYLQGEGLSKSRTDDSI